MGPNMGLVHRTPRRPHPRYSPYPRRSLSDIMSHPLKTMSGSRRKASKTPEATTGAGDKASAGSIKKESVQSFSSLLRPFTSNRLPRLSGAFTPKTFGTMMMMRRAASSSFDIDPPNLSPVFPASESGSGDGEAGEVDQRFVTSSQELSDLADQLNQMSLDAGSDTSSSSSPAIEPLHHVDPEIVDAINRRWREARKSSQHPIWHRERALSEQRQDTANNNSDDDDDDGRADEADSVQALSDRLTSTDPDSDPGHPMISDRDVSEAGGTTDSDETLVNSSESASDESDDSNDSGESDESDDSLGSGESDESDDSLGSGESDESDDSLGSGESDESDDSLGSGESDASNGSGESDASNRSDETNDRNGSDESSATYGNHDGPENHDINEEEYDIFYPAEAHTLAEMSEETTLMMRGTAMARVKTMMKASVLAFMKCFIVELFVCFLKRVFDEL